MNDEEAFQAELDRCPENHTLRLIFADWLEERDDPRAAGYRAMGKWKRFTEVSRFTGKCFWTHWAFEVGMEKAYEGGTSRCLGYDWFLAVDPDQRMKWTTRREAEDALAIAFTKLPPERQEVLLNPDNLVCTSDNPMQ